MWVGVPVQDRCIRRCPTSLPRQETFKGDNDSLPPLHTTKTKKAAMTIGGCAPVLGGTPIPRSRFSEHKNYAAFLFCLSKDSPAMLGRRFTSFQPIRACRTLGGTGRQGRALHTRRGRSRGYFAAGAAFFLAVVAFFTAGFFAAGFFAAGFFAGAGFSVCSGSTDQWA